MTHIKRIMWEIMLILLNSTFAAKPIGQCFLNQTCMHQNHPGGFLKQQKQAKENLPNHKGISI